MSIEVEIYHDLPQKKSGKIAKCLRCKDKIAFTSETGKMGKLFRNLLVDNFKKKC